METPYVIKSNLTKELSKNFNDRFKSHLGHNCSYRENIWRRHQCKENKELSGWCDSFDKRRRLIHFKDQYGIINNNFCLTKYYLHINLYLPHSEASEYIQNSKYDLLLNKEKEYTEIDLILKSNNFNLDEKLFLRPKNIFKKGIRKILPKGTPTKINISELEKYYPCHVELGCGPSIECGIPPLNYFHNIFCLSKNNKFVFNYKDDDLWKSLNENLEKFYEKTTYMQKCCLEAKPTNFYFKLKKLIDSGRVLEPIFNNNFDGIVKSLNIKEYCMRKHDKDGKYPKYKFNKNAKSLLVIGSHADRRECTKAAREKGLKIIFLDPQIKINNDNVTSYPLESPQNEDLFLEMEAKTF